MISRDTKISGNTTSHDMVTATNSPEESIPQGFKDTLPYTVTTFPVCGRPALPQIRSMTRGSIFNAHAALPDRKTRQPHWKKKRVLLVSSNSILSEGLRGILGRESRLEFQALVCPRALGEGEMPHDSGVLLIDTQLPLPIWQYLVPKDLSCDSIPRVLVVPDLSARDSLAAQLLPHAKFLHADQDPDSILDELRQLAGLRSLPQRTERNPAEGILTRRELDTLRCVAQGKLNKEISGELGISVETVKYHLKNIQAKLQLPNRVSAVLKAIRSGWIAMPSDPP